MRAVNGMVQTRAASVVPLSAYGMGGGYRLGLVYTHLDMSKDAEFYIPTS